MRTPEPTDAETAVDKLLLHPRMGRESKKRQPWPSYLLVSLVKLPSAWQMAAILYTAPDLLPGSYWCSMNGLTAEDINGDPCGRYSIFNSTMVKYENSSWNSEILSCEEFEFAEGYYSIIKQWQLVCERQILAVVDQLIYLLGVLVGGIICTVLLWICSPRSILITAMVVQIVAGIGVALSPHFILHLVMRFITAVACTHMFTTGSTICTGIIEGTSKTVTGCCYELFWSIGVMTLPCIASIFGDWKNFQLAISVPTVFILLCYRCIPEDPNWQPYKKLNQTKHKEEQNEATNTEDNVIIEMKVIDKMSEQMSSNLQKKTQQRSWKYIGLHLTWACTVVTYYGGLLNVKNLGPRIYVNTAVAGLAEIAGLLIALHLLLWNNRSRMWLLLGIINMTGGLCCLLSWGLPADLENWYMMLLFLAMLGRIAISTSLTILTIASQQQLPTEHRRLGIFTCVTLARVILLSAPFIGTLASYRKQFSLSVFGTLTFLAGLSAMTQVKCKSEVTDKRTESIRRSQMETPENKMADDSASDMG